MNALKYLRLFIGTCCLQVKTFDCRKLGLDLVPRVNGLQVEPDSMSPVELYGIHDLKVGSCVEVLYCDLNMYITCVSLPR